MARINFLLLSVLKMASAWSLEVGQRIENFRLYDHQGNSHELYYYDDAAAVVFMVQGNGCPIVRNAAPCFTELTRKYAERGVQLRATPRQVTGAR